VSSWNGILIFSPQRFIIPSLLTIIVRSFVGFAALLVRLFPSCNDPCPKLDPPWSLTHGDTLPCFRIAFLYIVVLPVCCLFFHVVCIFEFMKQILYLWDDDSPPGLARVFVFYSMKEIRAIVMAYQSIDLSKTHAALPPWCVWKARPTGGGARMLVLDNGTYLGGISGAAGRDALRRAQRPSGSVSFCRHL